MVNKDMSEKQILSWLDVGTTHFHAGEEVEVGWYYGKAFSPGEFELTELSAVVSGPGGSPTAKIENGANSCKVRFSPGEEGFYHLLCRGKAGDKTYTAQRIVAVGHFHDVRPAVEPQGAIFSPVGAWQGWHVGEEIGLELLNLPEAKVFSELQGPDGIERSELAGDGKINLELQVPGKYIVAAVGEGEFATISFWVLK